MSVSGFVTRIASVFALLLTGCASHFSCKAPLENEGLVVRATRASGGAVSQSSTVHVASDGVVTYFGGDRRCVRLTPQELEAVLEVVRSPAFVATLRNAAALHGSNGARYDSPHVQIVTPDASAAMPVSVALEPPVLPVLEHLHDLLRRRFGRVYRYPLGRR